MGLSTEERTMSFKNYKKGMKQVEGQALENTRRLFGGLKYTFSWKNRGSWHSQPPRRHPGWAAYHANKDKDQG